MSAPTASRKRKSLADKRRQVRLFVLGLAGVLIVLVIGLGVYALRLPAVTIASVTVSDGNYVDTAAVQATAANLIKGSYAFIVPHAFAFTYPRGAIIATIKKSFPSVKDVTVARNGLTALAITVTERTPSARWCSDTQCYFMDDAGMIFTSAASVTGVAYSGLVTGDPTGQTYLGGGFPALATFIGMLPRATGRTPVSAAVDASNDVTVTFQEGGTIRFNRMSDLTSVLANVTATFASAQFKSGKAFDYADFRFGSKVYVKWK
jgi:cell division septal protein FtsQ